MYKRQDDDRVDVSVLADDVMALEDYFHNAKVIITVLVAVSYTHLDVYKRQGHMFPLKAKKNGVLERNGHTEATVDLCRLGGLKECGLWCEIMREDGTMMRTEELSKLAQQYQMKFITIKNLQGSPKTI